MAHVVEMGFNGFVSKTLEVTIYIYIYGNEAPPERLDYCTSLTRERVFHLTCHD